MTAAPSHKFALRHPQTILRPTTRGTHGILISGELLLLTRTQGKVKLTILSLGSLRSSGLIIPPPLSMSFRDGLPGIVEIVNVSHSFSLESHRQVK